VTAAILAAAGLTIGVGLLAVREQSASQEAGDWARHAIRVLQQVSVVLQHVADAETGQRGYILTGDPAYLEPYTDAVSDMPRAMRRLRKLTSDDPLQQARLDDLGPMVVARMADLDLGVSQRRQGHTAEALETVRSGLGKVYMERVRAILEAICKEERQLLRKRTAERQARRSNATWLILGGSALSLLLLLVAAALLAALLRRALAAEGRRRESEERLRVTLRSIGDAVIATDPHGAVVFMNPVAEALTGWSEPEARGRALDEVFRIVNAETREVAESPAARVLREGMAVGLANHTVLIARDGREVQIDDSGAPIQDAGGALMGVVLVFRDVAEREAAEAARRQAIWAEAARAEADRANAAKDAFLAVLSHELRSPLAAMMAWVDILKRRSEDPATRERAIAVLERSVRAQTQLINDLLDTSRIVSGKLELEREPIDLARALPPMLDALQPLADAKGVELVRQLGERPLVVIADQARLEQVVRNLVDNAIKFTPAGGRVAVRLAGTDGHQAELTVSDTGEGFPVARRDAIFDRFEQSGTRHTRRHGGLGLGLAIVRHLVEAHGGTIAAHSAGPGTGATFTVRLPLGGEPTRGQPGITPGDDPAIDLHGVSVLLVEDDPDWREAVGLRLIRSGAQVTTAGSVADAIDRLASARPDVLVSDLGMPGADGYELIGRVRALFGSSLGAIAMTGFASAETRDRCFRLGFDDFLAKPFDPGVLVARIARLHAMRSSR
jgi:PAS domain S-box-containing protein